MRNVLLVDVKGHKRNMTISVDKLQGPLFEIARVHFVGREPRPRPTWEGSFDDFAKCRLNARVPHL